MYQYWREAHGTAMVKSPYASEQMRRCVMNKRCASTTTTQTPQALSNGGPADLDLVVSFWFDSAEQAGAFRQTTKRCRPIRKSLPTGPSRFPVRAPSPHHSRYAMERFCEGNRQ